MVAAGVATIGAISTAGACTGTSFVAFGPNQVAEVGRQLDATVFAGPELEDIKVDLRLMEGNAPSTVLASTIAVHGQTVSVPVTVPNVTPGVHYVALESGGKVMSRTEIQVLDPAATRAAVPAIDLHRDVVATKGHSLLNPGIALATVGFVAISTFALTTSRRRRALSSIDK